MANIRVIYVYIFIYVGLNDYQYHVDAYSKCSISVLLPCVSKPMNDHMYGIDLGFRDYIHCALRRLGQERGTTRSVINEALPVPEQGEAWRCDSRLRLMWSCDLWAVKRIHSYDMGNVVSNMVVKSFWKTSLSTDSVDAVGSIPLQKKPQS